MQVKCRYCQQLIEKSDAYFHLDFKGKNAYFCNEEHYKLFCEAEERKTIEKQKNKEERQFLKEQKAIEVAMRQAERDSIYHTICNIFGVNEIVNTILFKEWKEWNKVADNAKIKQYINDNEIRLTQAIGRLGGTEFQKIRYFSAILKNSLRDYNLKIEKKDEIKIVDTTFYDVSDAPINAPTRRGLDELEEDI